jgi:hypothetical protein
VIDLVQVPQILPHDPDHRWNAPELSTACRSFRFESKYAEHKITDTLRGCVIHFIEVRLERSLADPLRITLENGRTGTAVLTAEFDQSAGPVRLAIVVSPREPMPEPRSEFGLYALEGSKLKLHGTAIIDRVHDDPYLFGDYVHPTWDTKRTVVIGCWSENGMGSEVIARHKYEGVSSLYNMTVDEKVHTLPQELERWPDPLWMLCASAKRP